MISLSDKAAIALQDLARENPRGDGLRLAVEKGGCAGLQYAMTIDFTKAEDLVVEHLGSKVFVDPESALILGESILDYEDGLAGAGFRIRNPNAVRSCGCGTSFEPGAVPSGESGHG